MSARTVATALGSTGAGGPGGPVAVAVLAPAMAPEGPPEFAGALWVGEIQDSRLPVAGPADGVERTDDRAVGPDAGRADGGVLLLAGAAGYRRARLLVRRGRQLRGFVEVAVTDGRIAVRELSQALAGLPEPVEPVEHVGAEPATPDVTVVLCTRDRPVPLRAALASVLALDYPDVQVVVVDNASRTSATAEVVAQVRQQPGGRRVRLVSEPAPGLARARNTGVLAARTAVVAFTDDDVVVDRAWLRGLVAGFARRPGDQVGCVTGIVPSGEVRALSQLYFERRVWWSHTLTPQVFLLAEPPAGQPLFPFRVGLYGTGANFAVRRTALLGLGGFDEGLGVGSPTGGGEDIDLFVRMLVAGHGLAYEPSALVWHRHRADPAALMVQARGYGLGLGAWLTTVALDRRLAGRALRRAVPAVRHLLTSTKVDVPAPSRPQADGLGPQADGLSGPRSAALRRAELLAVLRGPWALLSARRAGARRRPLTRHDAAGHDAGRAG